MSEILIPQNLTKRCLDLIEQNADRIYVRECINGKWGTYRLIDLPPRVAIAHVCRMLRGRIAPEDR